MSPNRLEPTTTSNQSGIAHEMRGQDVDVVLVGLDVGIVLLHLGEALVPERHGVDDAVGLGGRGHVLLLAACCANSKANFMTRSTPLRVKTASCMAISFSVPWNMRPPSCCTRPRCSRAPPRSRCRPACGWRAATARPRTGAPGAGSRTRRSRGGSGSAGPTARRGRARPASRRRRGRCSRTPCSCSMPSSGIILPVCSRRSHDQSKSVNSSWKLKRRAAASSTRTPSGRTSLPIPSPGMSAILCLAMCFLLRRRTTYNGRAFRSKP